MKMDQHFNQIPGWHTTGGVFLPRRTTAPYIPIKEHDHFFLDVVSDGQGANESYYVTFPTTTFPITPPAGNIGEFGVVKLDGSGNILWENRYQTAGAVTDEYNVPTGIRFVKDPNTGRPTPLVYGRRKTTRGDQSAFFQFVDVTTGNALYPLNTITTSATANRSAGGQVNIPTVHLTESQNGDLVMGFTEENTSFVPSTTTNRGVSLVRFSPTPGGTTPFAVSNATFLYKQPFTTLYGMEANPRNLSETVLELNSGKAANTVYSYVIPYNPNALTSDQILVKVNNALTPMNSFSTKFSLGTASVSSRFWMNKVSGYIMALATAKNPTSYPNTEIMRWIETDATTLSNNCSTQPDVQRTRTNTALNSPLGTSAIPIPGTFITNNAALVSNQLFFSEDPCNPGTGTPYRPALDVSGTDAAASASGFRVAAEHSLRLSFTLIEGIHEFYITDLSGRIVSRLAVSGQQSLSAELPAAGLYLVTGIGTDGSRTTQKVMVGR